MYILGLNLWYKFRLEIIWKSTFEWKN